MGNEEFWLTFWISIISIITLGKVLNTWIQARQSSRVEAGQSRGEAKSEREAREAGMKKLEERVRVLEQIVTDNYQSHDLAKEIDKLREERQTI